MRAHIALLALALPSLVAAKNWAVGPSRTHKQITAVQDSLGPGDTVKVDFATYQGGVTFQKAGTAQNPIVILGIPIDGHRPVISGGVNTVHFRSDDLTEGADHYVMQGFEITGGSSRCVFHQGDDITLRDLYVHDCPKQGILGADQGSGSLTLEFSEVTRCGGGDRDHQIYMTTDQVNRPGSRFRMQYCWIHDGKGGNNVKSRSERNEIYYNWVEGAFYHELELIGPDPDGVDDRWTPRLKREDSDVMGNVFWKRRSTASANDSNFAVFRVGGDATGESHGRYRFVNNTIIAGTGSVFRCFDSLESIEAHNNVFYRPGGGLNLMRTAEANWTQGQAVLAGSNNWVSTGAQNLPAAWTGTVQGTNPGFADFNRGDLGPQAGGPLANAGNASPQGPPGFAFPTPAFPPAYSPQRRDEGLAALARAAQGAIDIGAFEQGTVSVRDLTPRAQSAGVPLTFLTERGGLLVRWGAPGGLRTLLGRATP